MHVLALCRLSFSLFQAQTLQSLLKLRVFAAEWELGARSAKGIAFPSWIPTVGSDGQS